MSSNRQYLADFVSRASAWFHHDCPGIPKEAIHWVLAADDDIHEKYGVYEARADDVVFYRRPHLHEIQQDLDEYSRLIIARVATFNLPSKYLLESILAELPDPHEFKRYIDDLMNEYAISEVSDSSYVSSDEPSESDAELLEDFM